MCGEWLGPDWRGWPQDDEDDEDGEDDDDEEEEEDEGRCSAFSAHQCAALLCVALRCVSRGASVLPAPRLLQLVPLAMLTKPR